MLAIVSLISDKRTTQRSCMLLRAIGMTLAKNISWKVSRVTFGSGSSDSISIATFATPVILADLRDRWANAAPKFLRSSPVSNIGLPFESWESVRDSHRFAYLGLMGGLSGCSCSKSALYSNSRTSRIASSVNRAISLQRSRTSPKDMKRVNPMFCCTLALALVSVLSIRSVSCCNP